jgi:NADPH-dependent glutamate synthase beta subunit-like oxidoreductase
MSAEVGGVFGVKWLIGALGAGLLAAWGWIANNHSSRLREAEGDIGALKLKLADEYLDKEGVERQIKLMMEPTNQRLDLLIQMTSESVQELRKLNDRVIRVESTRQ